MPHSRPFASPRHSLVASVLAAGALGLTLTACGSDSGAGVDKARSAPAAEATPATEPVAAEAPAPGTTPKAAPDAAAGPAEKGGPKTTRIQAVATAERSVAGGRITDVEPARTWRSRRPSWTPPASTGRPPPAPP
ncbi:hypothetical protein AB0P15_10850 [Streptomyces sp. NPDC087917]|uniref:hypothetical protein n=1 Tax=Streptomyces sp. NPDC087917 TaxID=3155060 RepID=UPI003426C03A